MPYYIRIIQVKLCSVIQGSGNNPIVTDIYIHTHIYICELPYNCYLAPTKDEAALVVEKAN